MSVRGREKKSVFKKRRARRTGQRNRRLVAEALEPRVMLSVTAPLAPTPVVASSSVASDVEFHYVVGGLFPQLPNGQPNVITSDSLRYDQQLGAYVAREGGKQGILETHLRVTTEPVTIEGTHGFLNDWLIPQLTTKDNQESIFSKFFSKSVEPDKAGNKSLKWTSVPRNHSIQNLIKIGYQGPGYENGATNTPFWNAIGTVPGATIPGTQDNLYDEVTNLDNYDPASLWANYDGMTDTIFSNFDTDALRENIQYLLDPAANPDPDLWYPSIYYTFQKQGVEGGNFNGPVLIAQPGDDVKLHFTNDIQIGDLSPEELELATLIRNSTYGNTASDGLGGTTTVNYHLHGAHTNPAGFGDNVVARYTAGQKWTTDIELPPDHGQGAYWYHAHYHPSVNQQVYGGLSGFMQIGDPLSKVPDFAGVPRNLAVIKITQIGTEAGGEKLTLTGYDNLGLNVARGTMMTVNGEFQPEADGGEGGWQALTLSNQTNDQQFQISLIHTDEEQNAKTLPIFQYGEDGHQFPQIRQVRGVLGQNSDGKATAAWPTSYSRTENLISLPPGKRVDLLFFLPKGKTEIASTYAFEAMNPDSGTEETYTVRNAGFYPDFTSANTGDGNIFASGFTSAGPLATFTVTNDIEAPVLEDQIAAIDAANEGIRVQTILPTTRPEEYDLAAVPSINLFATDEGEEVWDPIRQRTFNWSRTLVGPESEWDAATKAAIATYEEATGIEFERYHNLPPRGGESPLADWLGYANPWLINDHAFPNGNLTIAQLGTIEEWQLNNWSVSRIAAPVTTTPFQYIGHPFHIHINDFQVKNSDTELDHKRNLQDVVMLNSSGYHAYDANYKTGTPPELDPQVLEISPLRGEFISIAPALEKETVDKLGTWGANTQTIRMVFQDYVGTYVYHCHILPHEDAGMMQVITVIENTDSSWLAPSEDFDFKVRRNKDGFLQSFDVFLAQDYKPYRVNLQASFGQEKPRRVAFGDVTRGFTQDLLVSSSGSGIVRVVDGDELLVQQPGKRGSRTEVLSEIRPYEFSDLAPYAFAEDFTGDNHRDMVTVGYRRNDGDLIDLEDLTIKGWLGSEDGRQWDEALIVRPFDPDFPGYVATTGRVSGLGMQDGASHDHAPSVGNSHSSHDVHGSMHTPDTHGSLATPTAGGSVGEYGTVSVNHDWTTVELGATYQHPIVVVSDPAFRGSQPATVRLRNVESESFQLKLQEPSYLNGRHVYETLSYVVMEMGDWELADGTRISAGHTDIDRLASEGFETVPLNGFESTPTVLTQALTSNENDWMTVRVRQQDRDGFQLALQQEERLNQSHHAEHVGWIAIAQGSTTDGDNRLEAFTTEAKFSRRSDKIHFAQSFPDNSTPAVIAKLGSAEDTDPATLRLSKVDEEGFRVRVQEERSWDRETRHGREAVSYLALEGKSGTIEAMPSDGDPDSPLEKLFPISPVSGLTADQTGITMGDFNLDNFNDYAVAYATDEGIRVTIFDGAAVSLQYSTGQFEGGYFPRESILVDAVVIDAALENIDSLVLNAGFNTFYQSPIENLIATVKTDNQTVQQLTFQLNAGHFIATSEPGSPDGTGSGTSAHGGHGGHGGMSSFAHDDKVINLIHESSTPLHLTDIALLTGDRAVSTPVFSSVLGTGGLVIEDQLLISQGSADNGASSTSDDLFNTAQQLVIDLEGLRKIDRDDFAGIRQTNFTPGEVTERNNLANLTYETYFGRLPDPSGAAKAAASLSGVDSISEYVDGFLDNPGAQAEVEGHFGGALEDASVTHIVETTIKTLYAREAKRKEIKRWIKKVNKGLSKTMLPMAILQNTRGKDRRRVEFLSAASQFSNAQWANDAILLGSFGQGYADNLDRFEILNQIVQETGRIKKRAKAQQHFDAFMNKTVELIAGSKVSKAGFF